MISPLENREIRLRGLDRGYTATIRRSERWWIGSVDGIGGVNSQAKTYEELMENLGSALEEALEMQ